MMEKDKIIENHEFTSYWLVHASADIVFEWLRENKSLERFDASKEEIEKNLIERNEPLINIGLALYTDLSYSSKTALSLFRSGDRTIKNAMLAGPSVRGLINNPLGSNVWLSEILKELIEPFDEESLKVLLSNESLSSTLLVDLYERQAPFEYLTDQQWLMAIGYTTSNPRISTGSTLEIVSGVITEGVDREVFTAGWKLFETLPVDEKSVFVLSALGDKLVPCKPHSMDVFATIKKWETEDNKFDWHFGRCRFALAGLIGEHQSEFESLKDSNDIALRQSYYRRFRAHKPEEIRELFEKDNDNFLDEALNNPKLYIDKAVREELRKCCWDSKQRPIELYSMTFGSQEKRFMQEHPEWFADSDGNLPLDAVEDPVLRANKHLELLQKRIEIISQKLIGSESENQPSLIDEVKATLSESNQFLSKQLSKLTAIRWGWLIIGLLIGYILAKRL